MQMVKRFTASAALGFLLTSCASPGLSKQDYYDRLQRVEIGMSKSDFKNIFPESIPRGAKKYQNGNMEVLEISYKFYSFFPTGNTNRNEWTGMEGQPQWYYFYNDELVQFGNPEDWPPDPDLIIEQRER